MFKKIFVLSAGNKLVYIHISGLLYCIGHRSGNSQSG